MTVTITDTGVTNGGVGPQGNTTIYYTMDGSTPTTSSTVCNPTQGSTSCSFSPGCSRRDGEGDRHVGIYQSTQELSLGYGFVPSAVASAKYPGSGGASPVLTGVGISCVSGAGQVGTTDVCTATCSYTGSITTQCTSTDAYGTLASGWASSDPANVTITSAGLATAVAAGTSTLTVRAGELHLESRLHAYSLGSPSSYWFGFVTTLSDFG